MEISFNDEKRIRIELSSNLYSVELVYKCFYWYASQYSVEITTIGNSVVVILEAITEDKNINDVIHKIKTDLVDYKTREIVSNETKYIREMLIAKALANNDDLEDDPIGDISDPVGFTITNIE